MTANSPERSAAPPQCVFGPVPSRRLGQSLGIDPIPFKTCNFSCVYCQLGRTTQLTNARADYLPRELILEQVAAALAGRPAVDPRSALLAAGARGDPGGPPPAIDYVTFVGQGEPTLCASLGWLIREVKRRAAAPVAVLTNGALLARADVRDELAAADVVLPTLDAADEALFRRVNRPHGSLRVAEILAGLQAFRRGFAGQLWVEVMLVRGLNDDAAALRALRDALGRVAPDQVHVNTAVRPPAEPWVEVPDDGALAQAVELLGQVARVVAPREDALALSVAHAADAAEAVVEIVRRHPMREARLLECLARYGDAETRAVLAELEASGRIRRLSHRGEVFWEHAAGAFGGADGGR